MFRGEESKQPFVTVIIPVHNGSDHIGRCLDALRVSSCSDFEVIVIDDCSTDDTASIVRQKGINLFQLQRNSGPAIARNFGAKYAKGDILFFIDSDVLVRQDTIAMIVDSLQRRPEFVAVFGSYDVDPAEQNFISQYRNMFHHFHHQHSDSEAFTFWAGCGAIRKKVFEEMGGFDQNRYMKPSIEDIEIGYRICARGYRILLDKRLLVKHLKHWNFISMLRTDIFQRAIPWSRLIMKSKFMPNNLNLQISHKISSISVAFIILIVPFLFLEHMEVFGVPVATTAGILLLMFVVNILILNRKLYNFYARNRGITFMAKAIPLHILYYLYSGLSFAICLILYKISRVGLFLKGLCFPLKKMKDRL